MFQYTAETWCILLSMVATGALRQEAVKILYQTGFEASNYVTLLYLLGFSLSLFPYAFRQNDWRRVDSRSEQEREGEEGKNTVQEDTELAQNQNNKTIIGSIHGLQGELEEETAAKVHKIPFALQPVILGIFNMFNSLLRWASLIYIAASVSEMLISGMELALSVVAARLIRKRKVSLQRWVGVGIVVLGISLIGLADVFLGDASDTSGIEQHHTSRQRSIGILLILGKCVFSTFQDITEEIFMQAGHFPAILLLGMEGAYGFLFTLVLFFAVGDTVGDGPTNTLANLQENKTFLVGYSIALTLLFTATGVYNIKATQVTCAMTRNMWKNLRTVLVWVFALLIYYVGGNDDLGEAFLCPESLVILTGFAVMLVGIFVYYSNKTREELEAAENKKLPIEATVVTESTHLLHPQDKFSEQVR